MFLDLIIPLLVATAPALSGVIKDQTLLCSASEFACADGSCVSVGRVCDGVPDCEDGFDESICLPGANSSLALADIARGKRQSGCKRDQWQCRDGSCIPFYGKCDGVVDCADGSDESHARCRNSACQDNLFRCTYGACVDGSAPCNGVQECADNSDELLPRCTNETRVVKGKFKCDDGQEVPSTGLCDGIADCADGSDETVRACAGKTCAGYLFQCAYGACVDAGSDCNDRQECADNSDEDDELCNRISATPPPKPTPTPPTANVGSGACTLPPFPANGRYSVEQRPFAEPGHRFDNAVRVTVQCDSGYDIVDGRATVILPCYKDTDLSSYLPVCKRYCKLSAHRSVEYMCHIATGGTTSIRECGTKEFVGTTVVPKCRSPNYRGSPAYMNCLEAGWDRISTCSPECGRITPEGEEYVIDGRRAKHGEIPWHVGIYTKTSKPYKQVCGGSLVSNTAVITAAHCFWKDIVGKQPPENYALAFGKIFRPWIDSHDNQVQYRNISEIYIPTQFRGAANNYQSDIAIVIMDREIEYQYFIRPVCVDFEVDSNKRQLQADKLGMIAGWGLTSANGKPSQVLQVVELPFVPYDRCFEDSPKDFHEYLTADKFCAGFLNGTALCKGDSGGGLAFPDYDRGIMRYYLRGIVSTAPRNDMMCDPYARTTFTELFQHDHFIKGQVKLD